jgi:hypothetical protein
MLAADDHVRRGNDEAHGMAAAFRGGVRARRRGQQDQAVQHRSNLQGFDRAPELEVYSTERRALDDGRRDRHVPVEMALKAECQYEGKGNKAYRGDIAVPGFVLVGQKEPPNFRHPAFGLGLRCVPLGRRAGAGLRSGEGLQRRAGQARRERSEEDEVPLPREGIRVNYPAALRVSYTLTCKPTGAGFTDTDTKSVMVNTKVKCGASPLAEARIPSDKPKPARPRSSRRGRRRCSRLRPSRRTPRCTRASARRRSASTGR